MRRPMTRRYSKQLEGFKAKLYHFTSRGTVAALLALDYSAGPPHRSTLLGCEGWVDLGISRLEAGSDRA
jgi:hypothetical protein